MKLDWNDFYDGDFTPFNGGEITSDGHYYVRDCTFSSGKDRAISIQKFNDDNKLLTESCSFTNFFKIDKPGPAIYFAHKGQCCMNHVCGRNCSISPSFYNGHFSHSYVTDDVTKKNYMNFSTVLSCGKEDNGWAACEFTHGNFTLSNTNISDCTASGTPSFRCTYAYSPLCLLSSFSNCTAEKFATMRYTDCKNETKISKCNVLNNNSTYIIQTRRENSCTVEESIFIGNTIGPLFIAQDGIKITVVKCFIGYNDCEIGSEGVDTDSALTFPFKLNLDLLNTMFCKLPNLDHHIAYHYIHEGSLDFICALRFNCKTRPDGYIFLIDAILHGST